MLAAVVFLFYFFFSFCRVKAALFNVMSGFAKVPNAAATAWTYMRSIFQAGVIQMELTVSPPSRCLLSHDVLVPIIGVWLVFILCVLP